MAPGRCWAREKVVIDGEVIAHADATNYVGPAPVVAHPPCRAWGKLKQFAKPREGERGLALYALQCVRRFGGVLEHPETSGLWELAALPRHVAADELKSLLVPNAPEDVHGGWTLAIDQFRFGHRCRKMTWLYICGAGPDKIVPLIPPARTDQPTHVISDRGIHAGGKPQISAYEREHTPPAFAEFLLTIAKLSYHESADYYLPRAARC
jgi:hypothetical protein